MDERTTDKSLGQLLLRAVPEIAWIGVLVALGALLPLPLMALGWLLLLGAEWGADRWRGKVPFRLQQALFFWILGGGIGLSRALPGFWLGLGAGLVLVIVCMLVQIRVERGLRLERQSPKPLDVPLPPGASAWGSGELQCTPEGEPIRVIDGGEIAMGGPVICDYLMPDGYFIPGGNPSARFSSDGRHFVSPMPSRGAWGLLIFDRQERLLYRCSVSDFWELDSVTETEVIGRHSPLTSNAPRRLDLQALKAATEAEPFVAIGDLWLPQDEWKRWAADQQPQALPTPVGGPRLESHPWLPRSLLALDDPFAPLHAGQAELWIDGEASGFYLPGRQPPMAWRADGEALVFQAADEPLGRYRYWLWRRDVGAQPLGEPWSSLSREPYAGGPELLALEGGRARFGLTLAQPCLSYERYGTLGSHSYSTLHLLTGHAADDRPCWIESGMPQLEILLPLEGPGGRSGCLLQSAPLSDGQRATWEWLRDDTEGERGAYALRIGDWQPEGEWLIDHRVSDCGRYLALVAFAEAPTLPQRLAILDCRERRLDWLDEPLSDLHLQGFVDGKVHLVRLLGRNRYQPPSGPGEGDSGLLRRFDEALPEPQAWHDFGRYRDDWRLYYEQERVAFDGQAWRRLSRARRLDAPPRPWSGDGFVLPAPVSEDAAWGFGFHDEVAHQDEEGRACFSRDGYLLTASGIGVSNLAAPMIWSADGRYLALTRHVGRFEERGLEADQWRLLLLDVRERTLRRYRDDLGEWPCFEAFDSDLQVRSGSADARAGRFVLGLDALLKAPAEPLQASGARWLPAEEWSRRHYWERLAFASRA
ncbi:ferredoxin [Pseudomonas sp. SCB32]|uniref:ferredoxin n=1 Tax=Pseudomonas sp. SCB32 TaxID=2653853 RepID=UPI001263FF5F|nr:ferredoxin [Pseudomonas sp. SCB32]